MQPPIGSCDKSSSIRISLWLACLAAILPFEALGHPVVEIQSILPVSAPPGALVTLHGVGLDVVHSVSVAGVIARPVRREPEMLQFLVPPQSSTGALELYDDSGAVVVKKAFTVEPSHSMYSEWPDQTPRPDLEFLRYERNGTATRYYAAGNPFLQEAFRLLDVYWSPLPGPSDQPVRGHLKRLMPEELRQLGHEPADEFMTHFAHAFYSRQDPTTGLIPFDPDAWDAYADHRESFELRSYLVFQSIEHFQDWFRDDEDMLARNVRLAEGFIEAFDGGLDNPQCGMAGAVDVETGNVVSEISRIQDFGLVTKAFASLSQMTGDPRFIEWASAKQDFVWDARPNPLLPLYGDSYDLYGLNRDILTGGAETTDTDTLYNVRRLLEVFEHASGSRHRERALATAAFWAERGWNSDWKHYVRKLTFEGEPAREVLNGDGKYNTLYTLLHLFAATGERSYLQRMSEAWDSLRGMGIHGLFPEYVERGRMVESRGFGRNQAMFLEIALDAYDLSSDLEFLHRAEDLASSILSNPALALPDPPSKGLMGAALLRLALARGPVHRLEVELLPGIDKVKLRTPSGATRQLDPGDADRLVIYASEGTYELVLHEGDQTRTLPIPAIASRKFDLSNPDFSSPVEGTSE